VIVSVPATPEATSEPTPPRPATSGSATPQTASNIAALFAHSKAMMLLVDDAQRLVAANDAMARALPDADVASVVGADVAQLVAARHVPEFRQALRDAARGVASTQEHTLASVSPSGSRGVAWSITRVSESPCLIACVGVDITATRDEVEHLRARACTDALTGLPNRSGLLDHLTAMAGTGASLVFCDLNGFKSVNDSLGHAAGDAVLVQTARRLQRTVRGEDFVARLGGDEFVIVVPPSPDANFDGLARRLLRAIEQPMILPGGVAATVGMSIGEAVLARGVEPADVLTRADAEMYKMKSRKPTSTSADA
jgi:diguanylate cyclase (GGDEF)-like protein